LRRIEIGVEEKGFDRRKGMGIEEKDLKRD
jgi:hypothetical protein